MPQVQTLSNGGRVTSPIGIYTATVDPTSITADTVEIDVTIAGVKVGDVVLAVNKPTRTAALGVVNARVKSANTVAVTFLAAGVGAVDGASETYTFAIAHLS
jgi:hypothetical protein